MSVILAHGNGTRTAAWITAQIAVADQSSLVTATSTKVTTMSGRASQAMASPTAYAADSAVRRLMVLITAVFGDKLEDDVDVDGSARESDS